MTVKDRLIVRCYVSISLTGLSGEEEDEGKKKR
jgi:hypothetical protein